jgi:glutamine kinase
MTVPGRVYWITGFSGSGKSAVGRSLWTRLREAGRPAVFLDGDAVRGFLAPDLGYRIEDRRRSATRNSRICQLLANDGVDVVCSTISLFHDIQRWNRDNIRDYKEIYLRVPLKELERRDAKAIYSRARNAILASVVGLDVAADEPANPDLVIDNYDEISADDALDIIWRRFAPLLRRPSYGGAVGTKAETLERLEPILSSARVLPQIRFTVSQWRRDRERILTDVRSASWGEGPVIVRSSATTEDTTSESRAGKYVSVLDVSGTASISSAIEQVIRSFDNGLDTDDQVFVQPMLRDVSLAGVAFTRDPNSGAPYFVLNYDDNSGRTHLVTSGTGTNLTTFYCLRSRVLDVPMSIANVVRLLQELETILERGALDVEFALDSKGVLFLLQVRALVAPNANHIEDAEVDAAVAEIARKVRVLSCRHPYLYGDRTILGIMPDWNPAEIIGLKPKPLALSLYRELVTDSIWAYQRDNYGYRNLRSFPLLVSLHGLPYIDVRVSFNSFVPRDVGGDLAERLVNYYLDRLLANPALHDKVEFEIILSCYSLDLHQRIEALGDFGFSGDDRAELTSALRRLTNRILHGEHGLWRQDREKIEILAGRLPTIRDTPMDEISRIYWLVEDCKRYGTLPFAGLARAGFIAVQLLRSLVAVGVLSESEYSAFMSSLDTVGSRIGRDFDRLSRDEFLARYGHLRPGTYDILSPRYDEAPDVYFDWTRMVPPQMHERFVLSVSQMRQIETLLKEHGIENDVLGFLEFIQAGIEGREYAKFVFSQSLSDTLSTIKRLGEEHGLSGEECAFLDIAAIRALYSTSDSIPDGLRDSVLDGRRRYALTRKIVLPPLIASPEDVFAFYLPSSQPNFITQKSVTAPVAKISDPPGRLAGTIVFIPSADPGYDWIFTRGVKGLVTQFGGVNSHMAIRAAELGIPAAIGVGEALFERLASARTIDLDCANRQMRTAS